MNKEQEVRIITEDNKGVRCGHCGDRSKVGETWISPGRFWIGDMAICYGHKKCVEEAINKALLKQPSCETCRGTKIVKCTMPHDRAYWGDVKDCPDCQKPPASEFTKIVENQKYLYDDLHINPSDCPTFYDGCHCTVETLIFNIKRADKAETENKTLKQSCKHHVEIKRQRLDRIKEQWQRIKELEALRDTVQISCNPPKDCNDPVVLKKYMKGCFDEAMAI